MVERTPKTSICGLIDHLVDRLAPGSFDLVSVLTSPILVNVVAMILGVDASEAPRFRTLGRRPFRTVEETTT